MKRAGFITGIAIALLLLVLPAPRIRQPELPSPSRENMIQPETLVEWIIQGDQGYLLIDTRPEEVSSTGSIKTAIPSPAASLDAAAIKVLPAHRRLIVFGEKTEDGIETWGILRQYRDNVFLLEGGYESWESRILHPREPAADAPEELWLAYQKNLAVANYLLGKTDTVPVQQQRTVTPVLRPRAAMPVDEGC